MLFFGFSSLQVGHLLVDVLEPLYYMLQRKGCFDSDPFISSCDVQLVLDVDDAVQKQTLHATMARTVYADTPFRLLRVRYVASMYHRLPLHSRNS